MYSGGESTDSQKFAQWAMNPSSYQNVPNDQVDWAALAQQWIIMKEAGPPPIPGSQRQPEKSSRVEEPEGGEAEMDMDTEKDEEPPIWNPRVPPEAPPAPGAEAWANWNPPPVTPSQSWSSWGHGAGGWTGPPPGVPPVKPPLLPTPNSLYSSMPPDGGSDNAVSFGGYSSGTPPPSTNFNTQPAFWTGMAVGKVTQTEIKPHNKRFSKVNVPTKVTIITPSATAAAASTPPVRPTVAPPPVVDLPVTPPPPTLDANKRKQLPAWIREGLEKMERDKLKQLEREKEKIARDEYEEKLKLEEKEKMELLKTTMKEKELLLKKSQFDSDNEQSEEEVEVVKKPISPPSPVPLTQEELMRKVRNTMTEVLLKVTTQLIEEICKEEHQRYIKKKRASDQLSSAPSGALIKSKLGLDLYDEGSSSENQSDEEEEHVNAGDSDSDAELKEAIRRREAAYAKSELRHDLKSTDEEKKERHHSSRSRSSSRENENHSQVEPNNGQETKSRASLDDNSSGSVRHRRKSSTSSNSSRHRSRSRSSRRTNRYSKSPSRRRRSRSSSSRRGRESKRRRRRSRSDSSRYSRRSRRSRSRSSRRSKRSRRSRSRDRRRYDETSRSDKRNRRSRSKSYRKTRDRASRSSSRGKRSRRK